MDERRGSFRRRFPAMNAARKHGDFFASQRAAAKILDPFQRNKFNHLMETDLSIAARGHLANGFTRLHLGRLRR